LKGDIAKFGQIELSDVTSFFTFPDEKVISSTEYGKLLLWEGNIIKCVLAIDAETPCHKGAIESIFLDTLPGAEGEEEKRYIVTAGADGCIKFWDFDELDQAEGDDHFNYYIQPSKVIELKDSNDVREFMRDVFNPLWTRYINIDDIFKIIFFGVEQSDDSLEIKVESL